jgi:chromosome segregation ATPase
MTAIVSLTLPGPEKTGVDAHSDFPEKKSLVTHLRDAQGALAAQLEAQLTDLELTLVEESRSLALARQAREDTGIELYSLQSALARVRADWVSSDAMTTRARDEREVSERATRCAVEESEKLAESYQEAARRTKERQIELEHNSLFKLESENAADARESDTNVARRVSSALSSALDRSEADRSTRDKRIATLEEYIKRTRENCRECADVIQELELEATGVESAIEDCDSKIRDVDSNVERTLRSWKMTLEQVRKRDELLVQYRIELEEKQDDIRIVDAESAGIDAAILASSEISNSHHTDIKNAEASIESTDALATSLSAAIDDKKARYNTVQLESKNHEARSRGEEKRRGDVENEIKRADSSYVTHMRALQELKECALLRMADTMTTDKLVQKLVKESRDFRAQTEANIGDYVGTKHQIAQVNVETMVCENEITSQVEILEDLEKKIETQEADVRASELEFAQNLEDIGKVTNEIDESNRRLETLGGESPEHVGPLEAQISHLKNDIQELECASARLRAEWLDTQSTLLRCDKLSKESMEQLAIMQRDQQILEKKKCRHERNISLLSNEAMAIEKVMIRQQRKLTSIDESIARAQCCLRERATCIIEAETIKLQETDALTLQNSGIIAEIRRRQSSIGSATMDAKKLLRLIADEERKIHVEHEAQVALDPEKGDADVAQAIKENARLRSTISKLDSIKNQVGSQIQSCIHRRKLIVAKGDASNTSANANESELREAEHMTSALRAQEDVARRITSSENDMRNLQFKIEALQGDLDETNRSHENVWRGVLSLQSKRDSLLHQAKVHLREKYERAVLGTSCFQNMLRKFRAYISRSVHESALSDDAERLGAAIRRMSTERDALRRKLVEKSDCDSDFVVEIRRAFAYLTWATSDITVSSIDRV